MKKNYWIFAAAAVAFAACSNDDTISENIGFDDASAISFRAFTNNMTRAAEASFGTAGDKFSATAFAQGTTTTAFFNKVAFTGAGTETITFSSETKYYWPSGNNLDFYAWQPYDLVPTDDYKTFSITPSTTAASQIDFVYAATKDWGLVTSAVSGHQVDKSTVKGVTLNFRHAESKIIIQLKNSNSNVTVTANNVTLKNVFGAGTFVFADDDTDGNNSAFLSGGWTTSGTATAVYSQDISAAVYGSTATTAGTDMKLIPQSWTAGTAYTQTITPGTPAIGDAFTAPCITVGLKIQNSGDNAYIIGGASKFETAMFPIPTGGWQPGKQYTYVVDLAGGGYSPTSTDADDDLDPLLEGAEIKFVTVTVDDWSAQTDTNITAP